MGLVMFCLLLLLLTGALFPRETFAAPLVTPQQEFQGGGDQCTRHGPFIGGNLLVASNQVLCSDLISFGGTVAINGTVNGNVVAFSGNVIIEGTVNGDVNLYGGAVSLQSGSHVHGTIHLYNARWSRERNAQIDGTLIDRSQHLIWPFPSSLSFSFPSLSLLIWVGLGLLLTWLFPEHVMLVRTTIQTCAGRSLLVGLLSSILAPALILLLSTLIITIPLAIIVAVGLIAGWALGMVALGLLIGERLLQTSAPQRHARLIQVAVGLVILTLASSLPLLGWLVSLGAGLLGLGAALLSRFGTRLYGLPRYPLML
ncbi:polymer-forming cytoskeletal protein [Thermogemmatispora onikobensis]|uniref:polymer-forming cytoskeletal protein n=1 Tax=Thermogemmatispora onikobensis TaxID=732234 RepID=UPI000853DA4F|nr:polymer-forming cytoskeletal protein [Thermogemmatispora onikobensis]